MILRRWKNMGLTAVLAMALIGNAVGQTSESLIAFPFKRASRVLPVAMYEHVTVDEFRKLVKGAFEASGFSFVGFSTTKEGALQYRFSYPAPWGSKAENVALVLRVDEELDKKKRCAKCFLRQAELSDVSMVQSLPWMAQYTLSSQIFPAIDRAFEKIRVDGEKHMDADFGFNYQNQWQGERNLYGNSFVGVKVPALKAIVVDAYRTAGFVFTGDEKLDSNPDFSALGFVFPLHSDPSLGAVYKVHFVSQLDANGNCYPCEMREIFDPHQTLPAAGLSGMPARLTLASRFTVARTLAFDQLKESTGRYLRPRSVFTVPPKLEPLGSPRPPVFPAVVT